MGLSFNRNKLFVVEPKDQNTALPVVKELNEQELTAITGGWDGNSYSYHNHGGHHHGHHHGHYHHHYRYHHHY